MLATQQLGDLAGACASLGGRKEELETGSELLGSVECIVIEPIGKKLAPEQFVTTGVVICLQGLPTSEESMDEWGNAVKLAGWLDTGVSVVIPNLQMSPSLQLQDIAMVVWAAMEMVRFDRCILAGKDMGAHWAVELACEKSLQSSVAGVLLLGPGTPPCEACGELEVPACLIWARDDDVSPYEGIEEWAVALDGRSAPTSIQESASGKHSFDAVLSDANDTIAKLVRNFTATSLLIADLEEDCEEEEGDGDESDKSPLPSRKNRVSRVERLSAELPQSAAFDSESVDLPRKSLDLAAWMHNGMPTSSE